jgi:hypothetical protein
MRSPQIRTLLSFRVTWHVSFTQPPVSQPLRHYLVTPMTFLVLVCAQNLHGRHGPCLQSSLTRIVKKFWSLSSLDLESCRHWPNLGAAEPGSRIPLLGTGRGPPSQMECKILDQAPKLLELKTLRCRKQTDGRENLDKAVSFDQKGTSMYSL